MMTLQKSFVRLRYQTIASVSTTYPTAERKESTRLFPMKNKCGVIQLS